MMNKERLENIKSDLDRSRSRLQQIKSCLELSPEKLCGRLTSQKTKIFCVGFNKTGTTSTAVALAELGFNVAPQAPAEMLIKDWGQRKFDRILDFCGQFDAFQDIPFSLPYTFIALDLAFPNSKFVLTIRDSPEMWFESLHRYHCNLFSFDKTINWSDLEKAEYCYKGWIAETHKLIFQADQQSLFDCKKYQDIYCIIKQLKIILSISLMHFWLLTLLKVIPT